MGADYIIYMTLAVIFLSLVLDGAQLMCLSWGELVEGGVSLANQTVHVVFQRVAVSCVDEDKPVLTDEIGDEHYLEDQP